MFPNLYTREFGLCKTCLSSETPDKALAAMANRVWHSWSHWSKAMASWTPRSDFWHCVSRVKWYWVGERQTNLSSWALVICGNLCMFPSTWKEPGFQLAQGFCKALGSKIWEVQRLWGGCSGSGVSYYSINLSDQIIVFYHIILYLTMIHGVSGTTDITDIMFSTVCLEGELAGAEEKSHRCRWKSHRGWEEMVDAFVRSLASWLHQGRLSFDARLQVVNFGHALVER